MKKIIIVRHAKSSWEEQVDDHSRDLTARGLRDVELVSLEFKKLQEIPDLVISSTAKRAKMTADIFKQNLNLSPICLNKDLYDFSGDSLVDTIKQVNMNIDKLMVFGHNHALTNFVNSYGDIYIDNVPTSGLVIIDFQIESWEYIKIGQTVKIIFPRDLR